MKSIKLYIQMICLAVVFTNCGKAELKAAVPESEPEKKKDFKVVGYVFANSDLAAVAATIDFSKLTHLNIAFINPDAKGVFAPVNGLPELVKKAHSNNVKVLSALAGGDPPQYLKDLLRPEKRAVLVDGLMQLTRTYNLDGIDVDLEGDFVNADYEAFVVALSAGLKAEAKLMTAAVATWNSAAYTDKAIKLFDFINMMSYDQTGPWRKDNPGPHSTYEAAEIDFAHWNVNRSIPANKLVLGLPFYAYGFGPDIQESLTYGELVTRYPGTEKEDFWVVSGKGSFFYNGMPTIKKKVELALKKKMAGVMIWHVSGDAQGPLSLLTAINDTVK